MYTTSLSIGSKVNIAGAPVQAPIGESEASRSDVCGHSSGLPEPELQVRFERFGGQSLFPDSR